MPHTSGVIPRTKPDPDPSRPQVDDEPELSESEAAAAWRDWVDHGPQGPIEDDEDEP